MIDSAFPLPDRDGIDEDLRVSRECRTDAFEVAAVHIAGSIGTPPREHSGTSG